MTETAGLGEGEAFGEGVEAAAELHPAQQRPQLGGDRRRGHRARPLARVAKWPGSRANRPATTTPGSDGCVVVVFSVPRSSMRPMSPTLTCSWSSADAQAASTRAGPHFLTSPSRRVDLAHLGPRQRDVQQRRRVGADVGAVLGGHRPQPVEVTHRVHGLVRRQVGGVGRAMAWLLAGMDLDELAPVEDPHQRAVGAHLDPGADQCAGDRVERPGDLDVMVAMDLRGRVDRHVVERRPVPAPAAGASSAANTSAGRCWVVPCTRSPARWRHHVSARRCASARSTKLSPAKNEPRTNCTWRSTRGLSCGERTRAGSITNPRACAYSTNAWFKRGSSGSAPSTIADMLSGINVA